MGLFKNKKIARRLSIVFAGTILFTTVLHGASLTKKIDATFKDIKVYYNNQQKTMAQEPFIYNNSVYLPVRAVSELVGKDVQWDSARNGVFVSDNGTSTAPNTLVEQLQSEIASKNFEIVKINAEKAVLESKIKELEAKVKEGGVTTGDLKDTLSYIEKYHDYEYSIDWSFKLSETNSRISVDVSFDSRYYSTEWNKLTRSQRESFFKSIAQEIRIDHKNVDIKGRVIDNRTDTTIGTFDYSRSNLFSYTDNSSTSFSQLEKELKNYVRTVDGTNIPIDDITIKGNEDNITFTVYIDLYNRTLQDEWRDAMDYEQQEIRKLMAYLQEEIERDYKHASFQGFIEDLYSRNTLAKFDGRWLY